MKKNISTLDAAIRITLGLVGLSYCASKKRQFPLLFAFISAMKVTEGLFNYCPLKDLSEKAILKISWEEKIKKLLESIVSLKKDI